MTNTLLLCTDEWKKKVCLDSLEEGTVVPSLSVWVFSLTVALSFLSFSLSFLSLRQNFTFELESASVFLEKSLKNGLAASVLGCVEYRLPHTLGSFLALVS